MCTLVILFVFITITCISINHIFWTQQTGSLMFLVTQIVLTQEVKNARKKDKNITLVTDAQQEVLIKNEDKSLNY